MADHPPSRPRGGAGLVLSDVTNVEEIADRLADVISRLDRIEKALGRLGPRPPGTPEYLTVAQAAAAASVSPSHVRRALRRGELPASNVGTDPHPQWRIAPADLTAWVERRKGGTPAVPPGSEMGDLIRRHLPGLAGRKRSAAR